MKPTTEIKWYFCPICGQKLCQVAPGAKGVYLKCKKCRNIVEIKYEEEPKPGPEPVIQLTG